jgi:hypothetical protein
MEARDAVARLQPEGVVCAWPPLGSGLIPDLLACPWPGAERLRAVVCIGEPGGATEMPVLSHEVPEGWRVEQWAECDPFLAGFNDPPGDAGFRTHAALRVYFRR